jgi:N-acetylglucosaminyl-diphospho-decaprenol L-rhamnosyltransferase
LSESGLPATWEQVTVLVVTYNSGHCVDALAQGLARLPHLIFVDNASDDDTCARVRSLLPHAQLIEMSQNFGFGVANNRGLETVRTEFALLLNPDCVIDPGKIDALVAAASMWPSATMLVPQLVDGSGRIQTNYSWPRESWVPKTGAADGPTNVGYACAAVVLLRMSLLANVGVFDPLFFLYYEDEDLCLRVFESRGQILVIPTVRVVHLSRGSVRGSSPVRAEYWRGFHHAQSKVLFAWKHHGASTARTLQYRTWALALLTLVARVVLFSPKHLARALGRLKGLWRFSPSTIAAERRGI